MDNQKAPVRGLLVEREPTYNSKSSLADIFVPTKSLEAGDALQVKATIGTQYLYATALKPGVARLIYVRGQHCCSSLLVDVEALGHHFQ